MLRKGDLLFSKPRFKSKLKALGRKAWVELPQGLEPYSHSAIYVGNGQVVEAQRMGVRKVPAEKFFKDNDVKVFRVHSGDNEKAAEIAKDLVGKKYSITQALKSWLMPKENDLTKEEYGKLVDKMPQKFNDMFCSTVVVAAFPDVVLDAHKHPYNLLPVDIMNSPKVKEVKNGIPKKYRTMDESKEAA